MALIALLAVGVMWYVLYGMYITKSEERSAPPASVFDEESEGVLRKSALRFLQEVAEQQTVEAIELRAFVEINDDVDPGDEPYIIIKAQDRSWLEHYEDELWFFWIEDCMLNEYVVYMTEAQVLNFINAAFKESHRFRAEMFGKERAALAALWVHAETHQSDQEKV